MFARPRPRDPLLVALALLAGGPACKDPQQPEPAVSAAGVPVPAAIPDREPAEFDATLVGFWAL